MNYANLMTCSICSPEYSNYTDPFTGKVIFIFFFLTNSKKNLMANSFGFVRSLRINFIQNVLELCSILMDRVKE